MICNAYRNACCYAIDMAQLVARIDDELAAEIDRLVGEGEVESRSDAVRQGLAMVVDTIRRRQVASEIVAGYTRLPQSEEETTWPDAATTATIADEPW